jgi:hypothetical protein
MFGGLYKGPQYTPRVVSALQRADVTASAILFFPITDNPLHCLRRSCVDLAMGEAGRSFDSVRGPEGTDFREHLATP